MAVDKKISYDIQGGVKNYLGKQKEVTAPIKWKSSPDHPETELAYITKAEKDLLIKKDLHGSLKGGVNRGPSGIMSLNGFGSTDPNQNVSGSQISAAETGSAGSGMSAKDRDDFRSAAIAAGAGQRVNPGFFDDRNTVSKAELARAKKFAPGAFRSTRGGFGNFIRGGGILGAILSGVGRAFGLGKRYNTPYDRPQFAPGFAANAPQMQYDIYNEFLNEEEDGAKRFTDTGTLTDPNAQYLYDRDKTVSLMKNFIPAPGQTDYFPSQIDNTGINSLNLETPQQQAEDNFLKGAMAELTDKQKRFIDSKKFPLQENLVSPRSVYDTITNPDLGIYDTGTFGFGAQEPTTEEEYNDYLRSLGLTQTI